MDHRKPPGIDRRCIHCHQELPRRRQDSLCDQCRPVQEGKQQVWTRLEAREWHGWQILGPEGGHLFKDPGRG